MTLLHAYAISGAMIASVATWAFLQFGGLLIWGAFIGWAGFLHSGGNKDTIKTTLSCMYFGALMAWVFSLLLVQFGQVLPTPVMGALLVAVIAPVIISASRYGLLSIVPASFYGFAASFAFLAQTPGKFTHEAMLSVGLHNVIIVVPLSLTMGVFLGYFQTQLAARLMLFSDADD